MSPAAMQTPNPDLNGDDAQATVRRLAATIGSLLTVVEQETALVRAGRLAQAAGLESQKTDLARAYVADSTRIRSDRARLSRDIPDELRVLADLHKHLQARLQVNMTVLATAHAVSEGIIRGVSGELARKAVPSTYGAGGKANALPPRAAAPLAVSRSI